MNFGELHESDRGCPSVIVLGSKLCTLMKECIIKIICDSDENACLQNFYDTFLVTGNVDTLEYFRVFSSAQFSNELIVILILPFDNM